MLPSLNKVTTTTTTTTTTTLTKAYQSFPWEFKDVANLVLVYWRFKFPFKHRFARLWESSSSNNEEILRDSFLRRCLSSHIVKKKTAGYSANNSRRRFLRLVRCASLYYWHLFWSWPISCVIHKVRLHTSYVPIRPELFPVSVFLLPLDGMLVHHKVTFYSWVERGTVRVKCLAQEHITMSPARARTRTTNALTMRLPRHI